MSIIENAFINTLNYIQNPTITTQILYENTISKLKQNELKKYINLIDNYKLNFNKDNNLSPPKLHKSYRYSFIYCNNQINFVKRCKGIWIKVT